MGQIFGTFSGLKTEKFSTKNKKFVCIEESLYNDLYIDNQKKHFELLFHNPKNLSSK